MDLPCATIHLPLDFAGISQHVAQALGSDHAPFWRAHIPAPVHLDLVGREARELEAAAGFPPAQAEERYGRFPAFRPEPQPADIQAALAAIETAQRPIIVAGGGVRISGAAAEVVALAEKGQIPVAASVNGKGTIPENHPLSVGVVGSYSAWCANRAVSEADLVIFIGSGTGDQTTNNWTVPRPGTAIVQIDIDPAELGRSYPNTIGIAADARVALQRLTAQLTVRPGNRAWLQRTTDLATQWQAEVKSRRESTETPIRPERMC